MQLKRSIIIAFLCTVIVVCLSLGGWLIFDQYVDRSGWVEKNGEYLCLDFHGRPLTGWQQIDGVSYYFQEDGTMARGFLQNENLYYFGSDGGLKLGWQTVDGSRYYFDSDGTAHLGLLQHDGGTWYFGEDGRQRFGWQTLNGVTYYFPENGKPLSGLQVLDGALYCFHSDGTLAIGWLNLDCGTFYADSTGRLLTGWQEIDGKLYYFSISGAMQTGWHTEEEYRYYLTQDGSAAVGTWQLDGKTCFFTPQGVNLVLVNNRFQTPADYTVTLENIVDWHQIAVQAQPHMAQMLADCAAAGHEVAINSTYRTYAQQQEILDKRTEEYMDRGYSWEGAYQKARETVALPRCSEHTMGLAADLTGTAANAWLAQHCWEYGFIVRYPDGKSEITGIAYEPWHYRYVGTRVSIPMKDSGLCLEEYVGAHAVPG